MFDGGIFFLDNIFDAEVSDRIQTENAFVVSTVLHGTHQIEDVIVTNSW